MFTKHKARGIAIVVVLISAVIFLALMVAITGTLAVSSRQTTADQRVTLMAQYAAESGLNRVLASAAGKEFADWAKLFQRIKTSTTLEEDALRKLAWQYCNKSPDERFPEGTNDDHLFCEASRADETDHYERSRFEILSRFLGSGDRDESNPNKTDDYKEVFGRSLDVSEEAFWREAFVSGKRYTATLGNNSSYAVSYGLRPLRVELRPGALYRFVFAPRESVSVGEVKNAGGVVIARRETSRVYQHEYYLDFTPPSYAYFLSMTNRQTFREGSQLKKVFFNSQTILDGPIHTNGQFNFTGKPWFGDTVTSHGCVPGFFRDGTPPQCMTEAGLEGMEAPLQATAHLDDTPENNFVGDNYARGGYVKENLTQTQTRPEFALGNFTDEARTDYNPDSSSNPWKYTGEYAAPVLKLPTSSDAQKTLAETSGLLLRTSTAPTTSANGADPSAATYYDGAALAGAGGFPTKLQVAPQVLLLATTTTNTTAPGISAFAPIRQAGQTAARQLVRIKAVRKISNCRATPTGIKLSNNSANICVGQTSSTINARYLPDVDTFTNARANPDATDFDWQLNAASVPNVQLTNLTGKSSKVKSVSQTGNRQVTVRSQSFPGLSAQTIGVNVTPNTGTNSSAPGITGITKNPGGNRLFLENEGVQQGWTIDTDFEDSAGCVGFAQTNTVSSYAWSIEPAGGATLSLSATTGDQVNLVIGSLGSVAQKEFTVKVMVTPVAGNPRTFTVGTVTVKKPDGVSRLRTVPGQRLKATLVQSCQQASYPWPVFIDYLIDANGNAQYREIPSTVNDDWVEPLTGDYPFKTSVRKLNDFVLYIENGFSVATALPRATASDPTTAARSVAHFFRSTIATDKEIKIANDLVYEKPACGTGAHRSPTTQKVVPAQCGDQTTWARNSLGLFTSGGNIKLTYKALKNPQLQAVVMASGANRTISVEDMIKTNTSNQSCVQPYDDTSKLGAIQVQGGLIQDSFGAFGRINNGLVICGFERNMTYDVRMRFKEFAPPGFPTADNLPWQTTLLTSKDGNTPLIANALPLDGGFLRNTSERP
jgi:Domain of unknown function (DUF4900)